MFVHRYGMARAADPPKTSAGRQQEQPRIHSSRAEGARPWDMEHLGSSLGGHRAVRSPWNVLDGSMSGWHPSICIWCSFLSKHGEDPRKTRSWNPLLIATTHSRSCCHCLRLWRSRSCSLPPEWFIAGILSPPHLIADTTEVFSHFYRKNFFQKGNLVAWGLVGCDGLDPGVQQRSLEIQSGSKKQRYKNPRKN